MVINKKLDKYIKYVGVLGFVCVALILWLVYSGIYYWSIVSDNQLVVRILNNFVAYIFVAIFLIAILLFFLFLVYKLLKQNRLINEEQKKTEASLRISENELKSIFASMDEIILEIDRNGNYLKIAPTNPSLLYRPADELLGKNVKEVFPEHQANFYLQKITESLRSKTVIKTEYALDINEGNITFEASVSPLTSNSVLWIARDITERKQAEEEQIKQRTSLEDAQRLAKIGSWEYFISSKKVVWSKELYRIYEELPENISNPNELYMKLSDPQDVAAMEKTGAEAMKKGTSFTYEHRIHLANNKTKFLLSTAEVMRNSLGEVIGLKGTEQDITETKKMQDLLKLEALYNASNDAIMLLTKECFFDCNPKTLKMFGLTDKKEFTESHPSDLSPALQPDGQDSFIKANKMIDIGFEKGMNRFEWMHKRKNGELFPAEVLLSAFDYGNERVLQATVRDITERKLAEKKLKENEALLSSILQTLPVAVFGKNVKKNFAFSLWNQKAEEIFGLKAEECIGKNDYELFSKTDADWFRQKDIEALQQDKIIAIEEELVKSEKKAVIVRTKKTIVKDSEGLPLYLLGVSEDITESKKAEDNLRKSEEKYRSVVQNAADIIMTVDKYGIINFINHARNAENTSQIPGMSIFNFVPQSNIELAHKQFNKLFETKLPQRFETKGKHMDDSEAWYSINASPLFSGDEVIGVTMMIRDVTERKEAEEKIQHSLKEKEILLKEVHHRVKNNLQIILSILNLQNAHVSDKKTLGLLRDISNRIKAMSFIHELLYQARDFSKINFSEYISNITSNLIYSYTHKEIELKLDVGNVFLDLDRAIPCGLIINEIVTNALKYAFIDQEDGEISISLKQTDDSILLIIADNGKGLPATVDYKNTESLGMQLVITLVQQLRGEISLDNSKGAKYTIVFNNWGSN